RRRVRDAARQRRGGGPRPAGGSRRPGRHDARGGRGAGGRGDRRGAPPAAVERRAVPRRDRPGRPRRGRGAGGADSRPQGTGRRRRRRPRCLGRARAAVRAVVTAGAVGALVAAGGWLLLAGGGRRVREVLVLDEAAATRGPARPTRRPLGRPGRRPGSRPGPGGDVRVLVMQVVALLRAGASPGVAWSRAAGVGAGLTGVPDQDGLAQVLGPRHAEAVVATTRLALDVGAPLGRVLEEVAGTLVAEAEATADRDAALAAPRTT